jgi:hypothetical protein
MVYLDRFRVLHLQMCPLWNMPIKESSVETKNGDIFIQITYQCQYCKGILKELKQFGTHRLFKCKCKNLREENWVLDTLIINKVFPYGYWIYINCNDKFSSDKPIEYKFVFR